MDDSFDNVSYESPDETSIDYYNDLNRIEKESGINILSDKELMLLAIKNDKVVGALYTGISGNKYSFDVVVDKTERNKGIGKQLINYGISEYTSLPKDYVMKLDVVNPLLVQFLLNKGFIISNKLGAHTIMQYNR